MLGASGADMCVCVCLGCYCLHHVQHVILGSEDFVYRWFYMFYPKLSVAILWSDESSICYCCRSYLCQGLLIKQWCCLKKNDHLQHVDVMPWNKEHARAYHLANNQYRTQWAMFHSTVKLPEGTRKDTKKSKKRILPNNRDTVWSGIPERRHGESNRRPPQWL